MGGKSRVLSAGASSSGGESEAFPAGISLSEAYNVLGLKENASYEAVLDAKNSLIQRYSGQKEKQVQIELAYDIIFSSQLKARLSGDLNVSNRVRFADVAPLKRSTKTAMMPRPMKLPGGVIHVRRLSPQLAMTWSAVFGGLAAWTLAQGVLEPNLAVAATDVPGFQLALGTAVAVWLLREEKRMALPKALGLAVGGLVVGTMVGAAVESWLRVDIVPVGNLSSPGIVVGEFSLLGLWAVACFLA